MTHVSSLVFLRSWCVGAAVLLGLTLMACGGEGREGQSDSPREPPGDSPAPALGPADGHHLPATELDRVSVGTPAPDFTLSSLAGNRITLSDFRGRKNVILVFYRGHW